MNILTFIFTHDAVFKAVKQDSSLMAARKVDDGGSPLFDNLVFDEAYLIKFRELFFNAQGQITPSFSAYLKEIPAEIEYFERGDFSKDRDFILQVLMPCNFNMHMKRPLEDYIFNFLKDWIMYQWLETKDPATAAVYLEKTEKEKSDIKRCLSMRTKPVRRSGSWF